MLIFEEHRAELHLRIDRALLLRMMADQLAEHLFDIANQLNRGAALLTHHDEKVQAATINLSAGRKARALAARACAYLAAGMALLDERDWNSQYDSMFGLRLERAECEFLAISCDTAEQYPPQRIPEHGSEISQTLRKFATRISIKLPSFNSLTLAPRLPLQGCATNFHRHKNSQETVIAEDHEDSKRRGGH